MFLGLALLLAAIAFFAISATFVLPKMFLKNKYSLKATEDRGVRRYRLGDSDSAVSYEPSLSVRKYIKQYVLVKKGADKSIKCKIAEGISYIDFDIVLFDVGDNAFDVLNSKDVIGPDGYTKELPLPTDTAYVSLIVRKVNDEPYMQDKGLKVAVSQIIKFGIVNIIFSIAFAVCFLFGFSRLFGGIFRETFAEEMVISGWIFALPTIISAALTALLCFVLIIKSKKR